MDNEILDTAKGEPRRPVTDLIYSEDMASFDFGPDHPYKPERAAKTYDLCLRYGLLNHPWMNLLRPDSIEEARLRIFHEPEYLELLGAASRGEVSLAGLARGLGTRDNPIRPGIFDWCRKTVGGTCLAVQRLLKGRAQVAFNPLGGFHHAMPGQAEGFCYLNDAAVALREALQAFPSLRVAYVDLDAHHGNGVQQAFYDTPRLLFVSVHETGRHLYPWSGYETEMGEGTGLGFTVNVPLEPGADDDVFDLVLGEIVLPLLQAFRPDLVVAELGADMLISDPLTHLKLTNNSYQRAVKEIRQLSPLILALGGGGYDVYRTARVWTLAWAILNELQPMDEFAGLVGGMMFGPEMEVGSLYDCVYQSPGEEKARAMAEARRVLTHIKQHIFPLHGI